MDIIDRLINIASTIADIYKKIIDCEYRKHNQELDSHKEHLAMCQEVEIELLKKLDLNRVEEYLRYLIKKYPHILYSSFIQDTIIKPNFTPELRVYNLINWFYSYNTHFIDINIEHFYWPDVTYTLEKYSRLLLYSCFHDIYGETKKHYTIKYNLAFLEKEIENSIEKEDIHFFVEAALAYCGVSNTDFNLICMDYAKQLLNRYLYTVLKIDDTYFNTKFKHDVKYHEMYIRYIMKLVNNPKIIVRLLNDLVNMSGFNAHFSVFLAELRLFLIATDASLMEAYYDEEKKIEQERNLVEREIQNYFGSLSK